MVDRTTVFVTFVLVCGIVAVFILLPLMKQTAPLSTRPAREDVARVLAPAIPHSTSTRDNPPIERNNHAVPETPTLPEFTTESLARYTGDDPTLPIYLAFRGYVYDVSSGANFYAPGGAYHFLAGTDGTSLLRIAGGETIIRKYPVVGTFRE